MDPRIKSIDIGGAEARLETYLMQKYLLATM